VEDSVSLWLTDNQQTEDYVPPVLSQSELESLQIKREPESQTDSDNKEDSSHLPSRKISLNLSEGEEDCLIALRRGLIRYEEGDWVPSDEEIIKTLIRLLPLLNIEGVRLLCIQDLEDALVFKIQQTEQ